MNALLRLAHRIDRISEAMGKVAIYLTLLLIAVGFYNVVARYTGRFIGQNLSSNRWIETQWYIYSVVFFLMFAYNLRHNVNVRVDFLYAKWSARRKAWIDFLGTVLFLIPFCIMGIWATITPVLFSWRLWEMSPDPGGLPRADQNFHHRRLRAVVVAGDCASDQIRCCADRPSRSAARNRARSNSSRPILKPLRS